MPSTITHAYIGLSTLDKLKIKPKEIITRHVNNYKIYCQNMDVLYFYHILLLKSNKIQKLGHDFHHSHVFDAFHMLIEDNKKNKDEELFTFIAGLITHYQADSIIHPYINYLSKNTNERKRKDKHFEIETYIDNYYINKNETENYQQFNNSQIIFNYTQEKIIISELNKLFKTFYQTDNIGYYYYRALKEMKNVYRFIRYDKYGIKKFFYKIIDLNPLNIRRVQYLSYHFPLNNNAYYLNTNQNKWENSCQCFEELYNKVVENSTNIINRLYEYIFQDKEIDIYALIGNNSYADGKPIVNLND